jgi:hypothetical protein
MPDDLPHPTDSSLMARDLRGETLRAVSLRGRLVFCALRALLLGGCFAPQARHVVQRGFEPGFEVDETSAQHPNLTRARRAGEL